MKKVCLTVFVQVEFPEETEIDGIDLKIDGTNIRIQEGFEANVLFCSVEDAFIEDDDLDLDFDVFDDLIDN